MNKHQVTGLLSVLRGSTWLAPDVKEAADLIEQQRAALDKAEMDLSNRLDHDLREVLYNFFMREFNREPHVSSIQNVNEHSHEQITASYSGLEIKLAVTIKRRTDG